MEVRTIKQDIIGFFHEIVRSCPDPDPIQLYFNAWNVADIAKYLSDPNCLDRITDVSLLKKGLYGTVFGIPILVSRSVPRGSYIISTNVIDGPNILTDVEIRKSRYIPIGYRCSICGYQNWGPHNRHTKIECDERVTEWVMET